MKIALSILAGLTLLAGVFVATFLHAFQTEPVKLAALHPESRIISQGHELDRKSSGEIIAEINAHRTRPCNEFVGKTNMPELIFSIKQPDDNTSILFSLRHDEIVQLKASSTGGGFYCPLDIGKYPNLKALLESARH